MGCFSSLLVRKSRSSKTKSSHLPQQRRALSVSQNPSNTGLFDRLPFEIRRLIYVYALGGDLLHLTHTVVSKEIPHHAGQWSRSYFHHYHTAGDPSPKHRLCLLKTCRQMYIEASEVLYGTNTFGIIGTHNLSLFCEFSRTIRKDRLDSITSVYISCQADGYVSDARARPTLVMGNEKVFLQDWRQIWEVLATRMPGLKDLKVRLIKAHLPQLELALEEGWVSPMLEIRGLRRFEFDLAQEVGSEESTAEYNEKLERFQNELQASMCAPR
ncbi:MAG: hypothetical protein ASARMPRED_002958 [Alectoria sarmentosa]|nr:MAG: hypothetical protein ASARMPRED_002958 [Alectoria sarmentosa]